MLIAGSISICSLFLSTLFDDDFSDGMEFVESAGNVGNALEAGSTNFADV